MGMATKVSMRGDINGILSLQFMIESDTLSHAVFIDFRFLPLRNDDDDDDTDDEGEEGEEQEGED